MTRTRMSADAVVFLKKQRGLLTLMGVTLLGVLIGAALVAGMSGEEVGLLSAITNGFIVTRTEQSLISTLGASFFSSALLLMLALLFGFSAISQPVIAFIPLFRGLGLGFSMGYIYGAYGLKGILICMVLMLPNAVLSSLAIVLGCREALRLSVLFFRYAAGSPQEETARGAVRLYLGKFSILFAMALLSAAVDAVLTFFFAGMLG